MNINNYAQNHPELVADDLQDAVPKCLTRLILKNRGVNKWLRNRRLIIQLKEKWKKEINSYQKAMEYLKEKANTEPDRNKSRDIFIEYIKAKERMNVLADCRQQVRAICHSNRDVDFPESGWGKVCELPIDYPNRPSKNYFVRK